jgi:hypothetical protein
VLEELRDRTRGKGQVALRERRGAGSWEEAGWVTFGVEEREAAERALRQGPVLLEGGRSVPLLLEGVKRVELGFGSLRPDDPTTEKVMQLFPSPIQSWATQC